MRINISDGELVYLPLFIEPEYAKKIFFYISEKLTLKQNDIKIFGKNYKTPRLEGFFSKNGESYGYSGGRIQAQAFTSLLSEVCQKIEEHTGQEFNSVLVNLYRDGNDSNGWHSDDEKELGNEPYIASLSLGESRKIQFKHKTKLEKHTLLIEQGSLLIMSGAIQKNWKHQIPKTKVKKRARINLTFRKIID
ncbi:MAG: alpha-ketoglutarate-dependent dioxygenase AlkB [Crocinitomicaceae bacterium]|tara:strand:- start:107 stop:682 length:576 start_codon:yes stop_codon:yes gene_type:complete